MEIIEQRSLWLSVATTLVVTIACSTSPHHDEVVGSNVAAVSQNESLVNESNEAIDDVGGVAIAGLDSLLGGADQGGYFALAYHNVAKNKLGVHLWSLKDRPAQAGALTMMDWWVGTTSPITRLRVAALGPDNCRGEEPEKASQCIGLDPHRDRFVVATREGGMLKVRSFFASLNDLQLKHTYETSDAIDAISLVPVLQNRDEQAAHQFVTVTTNSSGQLKLTSWKVGKTDGIITQLQSVVDGSAAGVAAASPRRPWGMLTTSIIIPNGRGLKNTAWNVALNGGFTKKGAFIDPDATGLTQISAAPAGYSKFAVAYNDRDGTGSRLAVYGVDASLPQWSINRVGAIANIGAASDDPREVVAASGGAGRVFLAGDGWDGATTLRSWSTVAEPFQIAHKLTPSSGRNVTSAAVLKGDRVIVARLTDTGAELGSWRDYYSPVVSGDWSPNLCPSSGCSAVPADPATETPFYPTYPSDGSAERLIAASPNFVVSCGTGHCSFSDKARNELHSESLGAMFADVEAALQRNIEAQYVCDPQVASQTDERCPRVAAAYDSRVVYSQDVNRFVILTQFRNRNGERYGRYFGVAVSKGEDPRLGFHVYASLESIRRDDPKVTAGGGVVVAGHRTDSDTPPDDNTSLSWEPGAVVFDAGDLAQRRSWIRTTKLTSHQIGDGGNYMGVRFSGAHTNDDLSAFYHLTWSSGVQKLYGFYKDVEGPVSVFEADYPASLPFMKATDKPEDTGLSLSEYPALYTFKPNTDDHIGILVRVSRSSGHLKLQQVVFRTTRGQGFVAVAGSHREIPCASCVQPTVAVFGSHIVVAFNAPSAPGGSGGNARYMYLNGFDATPVFKTVRSGDAVDPAMPQNYLIAPDAKFDANGAAVFNGFWINHSFSSNRSSQPVSMRVLPR